MVPRHSHISIPSGAITGQQELQGQIRKILFQFHQVRLQAGTMGSAVTRPENFNSIRCDYRAIQSSLYIMFLSNFNSIRCDYRTPCIINPYPYLQISIPSGAITGATPKRRQQNFPYFNSIRCDYRCPGEYPLGINPHISIPSGAITGPCPKCNFKPYPKFQFHQVRLQVGRLVAHKHTVRQFQFHQVRLQVMGTTP